MNLSEKCEAEWMTLKSIKTWRIFVGFGRIPILGLRVMIENHIFTIGAGTSGNMFFMITSESKIGILPKTNKFLFFMLRK